MFACCCGAALTSLAAVLDRPRVVYPADAGAFGAETWARVPSSLRPAQVSALSAAQDAAAAGVGPEGPRGIVAMLGCGHGKTLVAQLLPAIFRAKRPVFVIPAALRRQFEREGRVFGTSFSTTYRPVISYEGLSSPGQIHAIADARPDLLIFDEAHMLTNAKSARWKRIARYLEANAFTCRVCVLSGTLTARSLLDMEHLFYAALRDWSPLPRDGSIESWAACVDVGGEPSAVDVAYLRPLAHWAGEPADKAGFRRAFQARLRSTRGVAVAAGVSADVSLRVRMWRGPSVPEGVTAALADLESRWQLPDGTELVEALEMDRARRQLSFGYFSRWVPGTGHPDWFVARKAWGKVVRAHVQYGGIDSPALVARAARTGRLAPSETRALDAWLAVRATEPERVTVWCADGPRYVRSVVAAYHDEHGKGPQTLYWCTSRAVGGCLPVPYHGAGTPAPTSGHAGASVWVHGKGWNGQAYHRQLVVEPLATGAVWEQLLARTHRPGQRDDVDVTVLAPTGFARRAFWKARSEARYIQDTTGDPQRLLNCDFEGQEDSDLDGIFE